MSASTQRLEEVARILSRLWDDGDLDAVRDLYRDDAVFISPTPPNLGDFGTILHGRAEIFRYYAACLEVIPRGAVTTIAVLTAINMSRLLANCTSLRGAETVRCPSPYRTSRRPR